VIETLVLNRLQLRPAPISKIGAWAATQAIEEVYGLPASALNDDRLGRALDEIHPHLPDLWAALVLQGAQAYGVRLGQLHSDVTRVAFEGDYEDVPTASADGQPLARSVRGYSGKADPQRKQLPGSLSVSADGGVPAWYQVGDGNAADAQTYLAHLGAVRAYLHLERPLVVGDSKRSTRANCLGCCRVGAPFLGPSSLSAADRALLRQTWAKGAPWHRLDPPAAGRYWGLVHREWRVDPEDGRTYPLRRLFVHSLDDRKALRQQRAKALARARRALWVVRHRLRYPAYRDPALVRRKAAEAGARRQAYVQGSVTSGAQGVPLHWQRDHARLREEAQFDGIYSLLTNLVAAQAQTRTIFRHYKDQSVVEGRFKHVKHLPLQVRPRWLHQPQRVESLVFVVLVALFLCALIEREARHEVQRRGQVFAGLRAEGRDHLPVTSTQLLAAFAPLTLVKQRLRVADEVVEVLTPTTLTPIQAQILQRLQLPPPTVYLQPSITPYPT
jgi:transposase